MQNTRIQQNSRLNRVLQPLIMALAVALLAFALLRVVTITHAIEYELNMGNICDAVVPRGCVQLDNRVAEFAINRAVIRGNIYEYQYVIMVTDAYTCDAERDPIMMHQIGCSDAPNVAVKHAVAARVYHLKRTSANEYAFEWVIIATMLLSSMVMILAAIIDWRNEQPEYAQLLSKA
ncbi:hypothetical protein F-M6_0268 [Faustovirus]|nr:hypothetical protein F-M6_0268 [Faustovirus]